MCLAVAHTVLFFVLVLGTFAATLSASVLSVTDLTDSDGDICSKSCSLREAMNAAAAGDTIIFARELRGGTIRLTRSLVVDKRLIIDGPNKRRITLMGDGTFRILEAHTVLSIDGLVIQGGYSMGGDGGGILASGLLNLTNVGIVNNTAQHGGGIYMTGQGNLFIRDSLIANNVANADGGGGGIDISETAVRLINSTVTGNRSNSAVDGAGGIKLTNSENWLIRSGTIAFNSSSGTSLTSAGGMVSLGGHPGPLMDTIVAKNTGLNPDFYGRSGGGFNLVGIADAQSGFIDGVNGNIVGSLSSPVDPLLYPLMDNGGGLLTHALQSNSPAIDSGSNDLATDRLGKPLLTDQRGYDRIANSTVDIGSYESNSHPISQTSVISGQVSGLNGRVVYGARVILHGPDGMTHMALTNPFGFYRFTEIPTGTVYTLECLDKRNSFDSQNILIEELDEIVDWKPVPRSENLKQNT
jgi:hypothetical protein